LESVNAVIDEPASYPIGRLLRERRFELKLTLKDVSTSAGLGIGFLSQIERDQSSASVATLIKLCRALGITVGSLFRGHQAAAVVRASAREPMKYGGQGIAYEFMSSRNAARLVAFVGKFKPHAASGKERHSLEADEEFVLVISGELVMEVESERYELQAGDTLTCDPRRPHRYINPSSTNETVAVCVIVPPPR
jgi:transcriptional regulator with XRE-family HTH domain